MKKRQVPPDWLLVHRFWNVFTHSWFYGFIRSDCTYAAYSDSIYDIDEFLFRF